MVLPWYIMCTVVHVVPFWYHVGTLVVPLVVPWCLVMHPQPLEPKERAEWVCGMFECCGILRVTRGLHSPLPTTAPLLSHPITWPHTQPIKNPKP